MSCAKSRIATSLKASVGPWKSSSTKRLSDRKSTRLNSSHTVIYPLSLHDALPISARLQGVIHELRQEPHRHVLEGERRAVEKLEHEEVVRSEEHTSELQSHSDLPSFPTRRSSDLRAPSGRDP